MTEARLAILDRNEILVGPLTELQAARKRCWDLINRLSLMPEGATQSFAPTDTADERNPMGKRPGAGVDRKGDREQSFRMKSADHFANRAGNCQTVRDFELVSADAAEAVKAWTVPDFGKRTQPRPGDSGFKLYVIETIRKNPDLSNEQVAMKCGGISRRLINRYGREDQAA